MKHRPESIVSKTGPVSIRGLVDATDWNRDGWPDVVASAANGRVQVLLNEAEHAAQGQARFSSGFMPQLPVMQPRVLMADLNGDGYICVKPVTPSGNIHVHINNYLP